MEQSQEPACEIVRGEYFSGVSEPAVTIRKATIKFSAACLRRLAGVDYVLISVYRAEKRLVVEPCSSELRDAIRWSTMNPEKRQPKAITGKEFYSRICRLMQ
ncbi:hypothetical protein LJC63_07855 [Ruminococcaceae bacterium OttesenSCG-928-L11]|nr:hypothetical protein [Ruminococcaceae bacterium OttesenSCG-928-L11]